MQNGILTTNTRQYFIDALKGVGLQHPQNGTLVEMSEQDIARLLDNPQTTPLDLYLYIKMAVVKQLQNDAKSAKVLQNQTAFSRQTIKPLLANLRLTTSKGNFQLADNVCDVFLRNITASCVNKDGTLNSSSWGSFNIDMTAQAVISGLMVGVPEQAMMNADDKEKADSLWRDILCASYKDWLVAKNKYNPNLPYHKQTPSYQEYYQEKMATTLLDETSARCGDPIVAQEILGYKIQKQSIVNQLSSNKKLLKQSQEVCKLRGGNPKTDLTVADVLGALTDEAAKARVVTFFQTRSQEQKANPKTSEVKPQNKIGNLLGEAGRKKVAKENGAMIVDFDKGPGMKKGKTSPWRGYKALYDRIVRFLTDLYGDALAAGTIGFVQRIFRRQGNRILEETKEQIRTPEDLTKAWKTDAQAMPDDYKDKNSKKRPPALNVAGEFYNKTKARLLADKMRLLSYTAEINDDYAQSNPNLPQLKQRAAYLERRIATAENVLAKNMPDKDAPEFQNPQYFAQLDEKILDEKAYQQDQDMLDFIRRSKDASANQEMQDALRLFYHASNATTSNQQNAKRVMAVEMFHLHNHAKTGKISNQDLDAMTERFIKSGLLSKMGYALDELTPAGEQKMNDNAQQTDPNEIMPYNSQDYKITAVDVNAQIKDFVEKDLQQHAAKDQYNQYLANQARSKTLDAVIAEK